MPGVESASVSLAGGRATVRFDPEQIGVDRIAAAITDRPGGLAQLTKTIAASGASIKEVHHDRNFGPADIARVYVSCVLETRDFDHIREIETALRADGFEFTIT